MEYNEIETFCKGAGFLFHEHGSGKFGAERYWSFYKVVNNDLKLFSIEYFPVRSSVKICRGASTYRGVVESLSHLLELLEVMRIGEDELAKLPGLAQRIKNGETDVLEELEASPLTERECVVLKMCFGIGVEKCSCQEIAERFGITPERVRQIKEKALRRLENRTRIRPFKLSKALY